jgi:hypothetical protein
MRYTGSQLRTEQDNIFQSDTNTRDYFKDFRDFNVFTLCVMYHVHKVLKDIGPLCYVVTHTDDDVLKTPKRIYSFT